MKKCPVCAVNVEDNAPFCNICGVNLAGAKDVGPSQVETPISKSEGEPKSTSPHPLIKSKSSFYLPAFQFLLAVALLGLIMYYTTGDLHPPDECKIGDSIETGEICEKEKEGMNVEKITEEKFTSDDNPLICPGWYNPYVTHDPDGCPVTLDNGGGNFVVTKFDIDTHQFQSVLALLSLLALCVFIQSRRISDSNIMAVIIPCILVMAIVYIYVGGGYSGINADKICADEDTGSCISANYPPGALNSIYSTLGTTAALVVIIVSYIVFLYSVTGKDLSEAPLSTIYSFIGAGSLVFAALHHNWVQGPWAYCTKAISATNNSGEVITFDSACSDAGGIANVGYINLQGAELLILMLGILALLIGVAAYILQTVRLKDLEEVKYFFFILFGLGLQFVVLIFNLVKNRGENFYFYQGDWILTVLFMAITFLGIFLFYRKRKSEESMEGFAYFGLFVVGIGTLFATMIAPALLSGSDISAPEGNYEWAMLIIPLLVSGGAIWYGMKFGVDKFRDRMMEMQLSNPPSDPFDSSFTPEDETTDSAPLTPKEITLEDAMDRLLTEFPEATIDIKPTEDENYGVDLSHLDDLEKNLKEELAESPKIRKAMKVDYKVDYEELSKYYSTTEDTINQTVTHLKSGRNIMLYGDPGTGKTALANLLLGQICGVKEGKDGSPIPNYTIVTANAEWSNFEVIGGISPDDSGGYYFKDGYVADAAKQCEKTMQGEGKPHYLVIDEFNRANIDEAFGKLFTVFEYRDKQALLTAKETGGAPFMMPPEFRIIGTMNTQDKNTLFNVGHALMRRFAFVEIGLPNRDDEYKRMPIFVFNKLNKLGIAPERPEEEEEDWYAKEMFDFYDDDGTMFKAFNKFMNFLEEEELPQSRDDEVARGVRTYRKIGPAVIIDSMLTVFNSRGQYELDRALEDVIKSNVMPALEGLERNELKCLMLKAQEVLGQNHGISNTLEKMVDSPGLSVFG